MFFAIYLVLGGLICFCIFNLSFLVFVEIMSFGFYLVNFECGVNQAVDYSLVYSYP